MDNSEMNVVLFSGGWESTLCAAIAVERHGAKNVRLTCVLYGQRYWREERDATRRISEHLGDVPLWFIHHPPLLPLPDSRVVPNRNEQLLSAVLDATRKEYGVAEPARVYIGTRGILRALDPYKDSNLQWAREMGKKYHVTVVAPCTLRTKAWVQRAVRARGIPDSFIFSSEGLTS